MNDLGNMLFDALHTDIVSDHDDSEGPVNTITLKTPPRGRPLRRTTSVASIETIRPTSIRRPITEIAEGLKRKNEKKKKAKAADRERAPSPESKVMSGNTTSTRQRRNAIVPFRNASRNDGEEGTWHIVDNLHSGVPSERDSLPTVLSCQPLADKPPANDDDFSLEPAAQIVTQREDVFHPERRLKLSINDVQLHIRPFESDVTIWDGLDASHHIFKCTLFLLCKRHTFDSVRIPKIRRIDMECYTHPVGSRYAQPPVIQVTYEGASPKKSKYIDKLSDINLESGIHVDKNWRTFEEDDGCWGWYKNVFVPLSPRLFDKIDYREFKLVSQVWIGEEHVESELTFGISMLLREVDMR